MEAKHHQLLCGKIGAKGCYVTVNMKAATFHQV